MKKHIFSMVLSAVTILLPNSTCFASSHLERDEKIFKFCSDNNFEGVYLEKRLESIGVNALILNRTINLKNIILYDYNDLRWNDLRIKIKSSTDLGQVEDFVKEATLSLNIYLGNYELIYISERLWNKKYIFNSDTEVN